MNEPKKRGRPSKAEIAAREANARVEGSEWVVTDIKVEGPVVVETVHLNPETHTPLQSAQAYALRIWAGQSPSELRSWRIQRVKEALEAQGLSFEGVELP